MVQCATVMLTSIMKRRHSSSFTFKSWDKNHVCACIFCVFGAVYILDGYDLSGQMGWAQNSDSNTHMKEINLTFRTEIR